MKRIYHPYTDWEEYHAGMWKRIYGKERIDLLKIAKEFTENTELYGSWMMKVIEQWIASCEHNLSEKGINRKAWIGHAACCLATGCPEDITREAWRLLTQEQRDNANIKAQQAIEKWERFNIIKLHPGQMELL